MKEHSLSEDVVPIVEKERFTQSIMRSLSDADNGRTLSAEQLKNRLKKSQLAEMFADINEENIHQEIFVESPKGQEKW
jgi:hypothetical protein